MDKTLLGMRRLAVLAQIIAGLVTLAATILLWRNVSAPAAVRSQEAFRTLDALQGTLKQLQPQVARIPETSKQTSKTLAELGGSIDLVGTEVDKLLAVSESSLGSASQSLSVLGTAADALHGAANSTGWVPNDGFQTFRVQMFANAKDLRNTRNNMEVLTLESRESVKNIRPQLRDTLKSTAELLRRYGDDVKLMESSVLPSLPPLLEATSSSVGGLAQSIDRATIGINLLCLALGGIGLGFSSAGVTKLLSNESLDA